MDLWQQAVAKNGTPLGTPSRLTTGIEIRHAVFSPDGASWLTRTVAESRTSGEYHREKSNSTWGEAQQMTFDQALLDQVDVSPDGKRSGELRS